MASGITKAVWGVAMATIVAAAVYFSFRQQPETVGSRVAGRDIPVPVEVAAVRHGPLSLWRTFSGTIEPKAKFIVAPKIGGRVSSLYVDMSDQVARGQLVVQLEDAEYRQAVLEAEARLAVAEANRVEAVSRLEIALRELDRTKTLFNRGIASESDFDAAKASFLTSQASVKVAEANLKKEQATLTSARIRLDYTRVRADWEQGDDKRTVGERFIDEGNTVAPNTSLLSIVEIDPVLAVINITEKDYPLIRSGQQVKVQTDAYPDRVFFGRVVRISPVFRESSRQARVEIEVANDDHLLKPGMFSRCTLELEKAENTVSVSHLSITRRNDEVGVFLLSEDEKTVQWIKITPGFVSGDQVQLVDSTLSGKVVILGQQFVHDGSVVRVANASSPPAAGGATVQ
ncbi:efflux RND transporter periplasmic adaptor subunit [Desulforhopalus singaporensis]|nr:efflux RND transporter periplasmic adaptor subunit [Desulforhopalus singaporensis]